MVEKYFLGVHVLLDELDKKAVMSVVLEFFLAHLPILEINMYTCLL